MQKILIYTALCASLAYAGTNTGTFNQSKFMPDISLIMDASYVYRDVKDSKVAHLEIPGVVHGLLGSHAHDSTSDSTYNALNGFNLNYGELVLSSSVDPVFTMDGVFHFSEHGVEIDEMYFTSNALANGLRLKGGKFLSNFGYLNEQHHHVWDFADMPLVYESFIGMHGINEKGLQLQWNAPISTYLMFGLEVLQGENEQMFGHSTIGDLEDPIAEGEAGPALYIGYIKTSFDIEDTSLLAGLSYAKGASRLDHSSDDENPHAFSGDSSLFGVDLTIKHYFDSYGSWTFQNELLYRDMDGIYYDTAKNTNSKKRKKQAGLYSQFIYTPNKTWSVGVRYDAIFKNDVVSAGIDTNQVKDFYKYSTMLEYNTSEFAKLRLQYNHNTALYNEDGNKQDINTIILQINLSIGAHAAHNF